MMRKKSWGENKRSLLDKIIEKQRFNIIDKYITKNSSLLDLGCGYNANLINNYSNIVKNAVGIDLFVPKRKNKIKLIKGFVDKKINLANNQFDIITSLAVIEHINSPETMLSESYRLLKKNGILLITTPSKYNKPLLEFLAFKLKLISKEEILDHRQYYSLNTLKKDLIKAGFLKKNIEIKYFQFGLNIFAKAIK